jgi:hypothetical protein
LTGVAASPHLVETQRRLLAKATEEIANVRQQATVARRDPPWATELDYWRVEGELRGIVSDLETIEHSTGDERLGRARQAVQDALDVERNVVRKGARAKKADATGFEDTMVAHQEPSASNVPTLVQPGAQPREKNAPAPEAEQWFVQMDVALRKLRTIIESEATKNPGLNWGALRRAYQTLQGAIDWSAWESPLHNEAKFKAAAGLDVTDMLYMVTDRMREGLEKIPSGVEVDRRKLQEGLELLERGRQKRDASQAPQREAKRNACSSCRGTGGSVKTACAICDGLGIEHGSVPAEEAFPFEPLPVEPTPSTNVFPASTAPAPPIGDVSDLLPPEEAERDLEERVEEHVVERDDLARELEDRAERVVDLVRRFDSKSAKAPTRAVEDLDAALASPKRKVSKPKSDARLMTEPANYFGGPELSIWK